MLLDHLFGWFVVFSNSTQPPISLFACFYPFIALYDQHPIATLKQKETLNWLSAAQRGLFGTTGWSSNCFSRREGQEWSVIQVACTCTRKVGLRFSLLCLLTKNTAYDFDSLVPPKHGGAAKVCMAFVAFCSGISFVCSLCCLSVSRRR